MATILTFVYIVQKKKKICTERIFHIFKIQPVFFLTLTVVASSTQFFAILENFDIQKLIEGLDINPNFKKQKEDYRVNFGMKFQFLRFTAYFSIWISKYEVQNMNFSKFSSKSHIILFFHQLLILLQYCAKFSIKSSDFFFKY